MTKREETVANYEPPPGMSLTQKVAHFLDWASKHVKYQYFQPNEIVKVINSYNHTPRLNSKETASVKACMYRVRTILREEYGRGYVCQRKIGYRATVNDDDKARFDLPDRAKRLVTAHNNVNHSLSLIDVNKISSTDEGKKLRGFVKNVKQISGLISEDRIQKLLPPVTEENPET